LGIASLDDDNTVLEKKLRDFEYLISVIENEGEDVGRNFRVC
jgi:hypothetical protein